MNIMDKETVLRVSKAVHITGNIDQKDAIEILVGFVADNGKNAEEAYNMVSKIAQNGLFSFCLPTALEHYEKEFNIVKVIKDNKIINIF